MAYTLTWSPAARFDLWDVLSYISEFEPETAARFGEGIFDAVDRLVEFPESGRIVPEFRDPTIREIIRKPCRIVYRVKKDEGITLLAAAKPGEGQSVGDMASVLHRFLAGRLKEAGFVNRGGKGSHLNFTHSQG